MAKFWILIFLIIFYVPSFGQDKCFTPDQQRKLLVEINHARTCDTIIDSLKNGIILREKKIGKLEELIQVKQSENNLQKTYVENLIEEARAMDEKFMAQQKEIKKEQRRKAFYKITTFLLVISTGVFILI